MGQIDRAEACDYLIALLFAWYDGRLNVTKHLLDAGASINLSVKDGIIALHSTIQEGHTAIVGLLLSRGANVEAPMSDGSHPLHIAATAPHGLQLVFHLIS
jgi:ankyrin repeat protein